jgi:hypothetical protein
MIDGVSPGLIINSNMGNFNNWSTTPSRIGFIYYMDAFYTQAFIDWVTEDDFTLL